VFVVITERKIMINIEDYRNITSINNVTILHGDRDYYFLHQKNTGQNQLDYYVKNKLVDKGVLKNYLDNIENNAYLSSKYNFQYVHMICESKEIAHKNIIKEYSGLELHSIVTNQHLLSEVIYPQLDPKDYYVGDSHNNSRGALKQCIAVIKKLGLALPHFTPEYTEYELLNGDLASKLGIEKTKEVKLDKLKGAQEPDISAFRLSEFMVGNSGNIQYIYNSRAFFQKRLLCFADSFVGSHLEVYSLFFEEVILLRSPFIIESIIVALEPDYVLTSNAERYLVNVPLFSKTPWFLNYLQVGKIKRSFTDRELVFLRGLFEGRNSSEMQTWREKHRTNLPVGLTPDEYLLEHIKNQRDLEVIVKLAVKNENSDLNLSRKLMKLACEFNPEGEFIRKKLESYNFKTINSPSHRLL
jgi:hypothetical protein